MGKKGGAAPATSSEVDKTPWRKNLPYKPKDGPVKARPSRSKMVFGRAEGEKPSLEALERKLEYQRRKAEVRSGDGGNGCGDVVMYKYL